MGSVSTKVGTPSILVMAKSQPRSHSSTVHLDRCLTIMRLSLIIALLDGYRLGRDLSVYGEHASLYCFCSFCFFRQPCICLYTTYGRAACKGNGARAARSNSTGKLNE